MTQRLKAVREQFVSKLRKEATARRAAKQSSLSHCVILLASYPNSGSTWLRHLHAAATRLRPETVYPTEYRPTWHSRWGTFSAKAAGRDEASKALRGKMHAANGTSAECSFVKTHSAQPQRVLAILQKRVGRDRGSIRGNVVLGGVAFLHRNSHDNAWANYRYLVQTHGERFCARPQLANHPRVVALLVKEARRRAEAQHAAWHCELRAATAGLNAHST